MIDRHDSRLPESAATDVGEFCRLVEEHLTRVNEGHLVRIVGPAFEMVRAWAVEGVPFSIVCHGIDRKAARHRAGRSKRPLRLEFCEADVREVYEGWRRAIGLVRLTATGADPDAQNGSPEPPHRAPLSKHLDRLIERLSRTAGRLDLPDNFREQLALLLGELGSLRDQARNARGAAREPIVRRLLELDEQVMVAARHASAPSVLDELRRGVEAELESYRARLSAEAWGRSVELGVDRQLRERLGLPALDPQA